MTKKVHESKKKWYPLIAPKLFSEQPLGDVPLYEPETAIGRMISANLMTLTDDPKKQHISVMFRITGLANGQLQTEITGMAIQQTAVKRMVRRKKIRIDESFLCITKDGVQVRIKPFLVTHALAKGSVLRALHKQTLQFLKKEIGKSEFEQVISDIILRKLQQALQQHLKKTYPLAICEIRQILVVGKHPAPPAPQGAPEAKLEGQDDTGEKQKRHRRAETAATPPDAPAAEADTADAPEEAPEEADTKDAAQPLEAPVANI